MVQAIESYDQFKKLVSKGLVASCDHLSDCVLRDGLLHHYRSARTRSWLLTSVSEMRHSRDYIAIDQ